MPVEFNPAMIPWVESIVSATMRRRRIKVDDDKFEDLKQAGVIAMWKCCQRFDEEAGSSFKTFAGNRIVGAMLDELRTQAWGKKKACFEPLSIDEIEYDCWVDESPLADEMIHDQQREQVIDDAIKSLSDREERVLRLRYMDGLSTNKVGKRMGCSGSNVSLITTKGLKKLRENELLKQHWKEAA